MRHRLPKSSGSSSGLNGLMRVENGHDSGQRVLNMKKLSKIAASLSIALCILRKEGTIHADIKPENCFVRPKCESSSSSSFPSSSSRSVSGSQNPSPSPSTPTSTPYSILVSDSLNDFSEDFDLHLGDFGNSIHASDVSKYYTDFDLQTLSYRAPEVLLGVPFGHQIDVWSLGILLIELCIGKPLFHARTRQELYDSMCEFLTAPPRVRFAGGMYSELQTNSNSIKRKIFDFGLEDSSPLITSNSQNTKINFAEHLSNVKKLLEKYVVDVPSNLIHFLSGMVHPDPDYRLTAMDAVRHPFLSGGLNVPLCMIGKTSPRTFLFCLYACMCVFIYAHQSGWLATYSPIRQSINQSIYLSCQDYNLFDTIG